MMVDMFIGNKNKFEIDFFLKDFENMKHNIKSLYFFINRYRKENLYNHTIYLSFNFSINVKLNYD